MSGPDVTQLKPVYLIYGSEEYLLEQAVDRLTNAFAAVADLDFNRTVFDGQTASVAEIITVANTVPSFAERRLVLVRRADRMSTADLRILAEYAADPSPSTTLVLVATKAARNTRIYKAVDALGGVAEYRPPARGEYPRAVVRMFAERGKQVGLDGAGTLVRRVGRDLRRLSVEIDKVISYAGDATVISREVIEEVTSSSAPTSVFDFLDALGARDCGSALATLARLVDSGESIHRIHAMSVRQVRDLISARALVDRDGERSARRLLETESGVLGWRTSGLIVQADRFSMAELVDALRAAAAGEADMKTSREPRLVFELWILELCGASGRPRTRA
ncbi:MAG TPA: DNA polymerase III subunit delta [Coriobacteriia bacterium]|nr:DNA polymerase III subunit delta [Coriobacteriia bacterium]